MTKKQAHFSESEERFIVLALNVATAYQDDIGWSYPPRDLEHRLSMIAKLRAEFPRLADALEQFTPVAVSFD